MLKLKIFIIILFCLFYTQIFASNFQYPFDKISSPSCRFSSWNSLGDDCKIDLPKIINADYEKYKLDKNMRKIYSILWGATYDYGWDIGNGSHLGVDIATSEETPVKSIGDGEVITAGWVNGYGNTVVIKHKSSDGKIIYSNYSHLKKIITSKGNIKVGEIIGEVGNTGNSYGNHLHFQIDITNQGHPYWYINCAKGTDIMSVVNLGMCKDYMTTNTIDPILFLESGGKFIQIQKTPNIIIDKKTIKARNEILEEEMEEFLKTHNIQFKVLSSGYNLEIQKNYKAKILINYYNKPFSGNLPELGIEFVYDKKALGILPEKILIIDKGERLINIKGLKTGKHKIEIKIGKKIIYTTYVNVYKQGELNNPTNASFIFKKNKEFILGSENLTLLVFKTNFGSNQINIPYFGKYTIKALSGKAKFCNVSRINPRSCEYFNIDQELNFTFEDTYKGILLFNIIPLDYDPIKLILYKQGSQYPITEIKFQISIKNPINLDGGYIYYNSCINGLKKFLIKLNQGYLTQERDILGRQVKELISNFLSYEFLKVGNNFTKKNKIKQLMLNFNLQNKFIDDYSKISRGEFIKIFLNAVSIELILNDNQIFIDEQGYYKNYITTLRSKFNFRWKDQFGDRYFQPDKLITIGEALYIVDIISSQF